MRVALVQIAALVVALLALVACDDRGQQTRRRLAERFLAGHGAEAQGPAVATSRVPEGEGWSAALQRAARRGDGLTWTAAARYEGNGAQERRGVLEVDATLHLRKDGAYRSELRYRFETPEGRQGQALREALWVDHKLYTRLDDGPWFERPGLHGQVESWRDASVEAISGLPRGLGALLRAVPGRDGQSWSVEKRADADIPALGADRMSEAGWPIWFAGRFSVREVAGKGTLDEASGAPRSFELGCTLEGGLDAAPVTLRVEGRAKLSPPSKKATLWTPPKDARSADRERGHARIQRLLKPWLDSQ